MKNLMRKVHSDRAAAIKTFYSSMKAQEQLYVFMKRKKERLNKQLHDLNEKLFNKERQRIYVDFESDDSQ